MTRPKKITLQGKAPFEMTLDPLEAKPGVYPGLAELTGKHLPGGQPLFKDGEPHRTFEEARQTFMEQVQKNP